MALLGLQSAPARAFAIASSRLERTVGHGLQSRPSCSIEFFEVGDVVALPEPDDQQRRTVVGPVRVSEPVREVLPGRSEVDRDGVGLLSDPVVDGHR